MFSEVAPALRAAGHVDEANCVEELAIPTTTTMTIDILCAYPMHSADQSADRTDQFKAICAQHGAIIIR